MPHVYRYTIQLLHRLLILVNQLVDAPRPFVLCLCCPPPRKVHEGSSPNSSRYALANRPKLRKPQRCASSDTRNVCDRPLCRARYADCIRRRWAYRMGLTPICSLQQLRSIRSDTPSAPARCAVGGLPSCQPCKCASKRLASSRCRRAAGFSSAAGVPARHLKELWINCCSSPCTA